MFIVSILYVYSLFISEKQTIIRNYPFYALFKMLVFPGALLVYDVSSRESFNNLANWLTDARTLASPAIVIILVGNKKDLDEEREVTFLEASR